MTSQPDTTVDVDVDVDLIAGCSVFTECPGAAAWLVIFTGTQQPSWPICEHHRPVFIDVMAGAGLDTGQISFARI